jgi:parallel beta-helix repeat protein
MRKHHNDSRSIHCIISNFRIIGLPQRTVFLTPVFFWFAVMSCLAQAPSGPLVLAGQNGTIIENLKITSTTGDCVTITGSTNITIRNSEIGPCKGNAVIIRQTNGVKVFDSYIHPEAVITRCCDTGEGVLAYQSSNIQIQGNVIAYGESNIVITGSGTANVIGNFLLNPRNFISRGQNVLVGGSNQVLIDSNYTLSSSDKTKYTYLANQEDSINIEDSTGVTVSNNYLTGGSSPSGCGILAEAGASQVRITNNIIVDTGQCGIGIADGTNNVVDGNRVIDSTPVPGAGNTALYVWRGDPNSGPCSNISFTNNIASQLKPNGVESGYWNGGGCEPVTLSGNTFDAAARALLSPVATKLPPPLIPERPYSCVAVSPFSNQKSVSLCNGAGAGQSQSSGSAPVTDNFNKGSLDLSRWTFVNPATNGSYSLNASELSLTAPAGSNHDPGYLGSDNAVRVVQSIGGGDFTVDVKFDSIPSLKYQFEGLIVEQDAGNYLRFHAGSAGNSLEIGATKVVSHLETSQFGAGISVPNGANSLWLRVQKSGNTWTESWSTNGSSFNIAGVFVQPLTISNIGPFAGNYGSAPSAAPAFTAVIDYFLNTAAP